MQIIKIGVDNVPQSVKDGVEQYVATMKRNGLKVGPIVVTASHQRSAYSSMMAGYGLSMSPAMVVRAIEMVDATPVAIRQILSRNKSPLRKRGQHPRFRGLLFPVLSTVLCSRPLRV